MKELEDGGLCKQLQMSGAFILVPKGALDLCISFRQAVNNRAINAISTCIITVCCLMNVARS